MVHLTRRASALPINLAENLTALDREIIEKRIKLNVFHFFGQYHQMKSYLAISLKYTRFLLRLDFSSVVVFCFHMCDFHGGS